VDLALEDRGLAGQGLLAVLLREGDGDVLRVLGLQADKLLLKAGDKGVAAQHQLIVLGLAAVEGHAVHAAVEIDDDGVALAGGAVNGDLTGVALLHAGELGLDLLVGDGVLGTLGGQALVVLEGDLRLNRRDGDKGEHAVLDVDVGDARLVDRLDAGLGHRGLIGVGDADVHGLLIEETGAVELLDHLARRAAGAEALNVDLADVLAVCFLTGVLKGLGLDGDVQRDLVVLFLFDVGQFHKLFLQIFLVLILRF